MRRLSGLCGYASRQDVLLAAEMDTASEVGDFGVWVAYRKAKRANKDALRSGDNGSRDKSPPGMAAPRMPLIVALESEIVVTRVTVSIITLLGVHTQRTGMVALPRPIGKGKASR